MENERRPRGTLGQLIRRACYARVVIPARRPSIAILAVGCLLVAACGAVVPSGPNGPLGASATVFDDEFSGTALDTNAWVAMNRPGDASNSEAQCYIPNDAAVTGGSLVITTKVDSSCSNFIYTSAMVQWKTFNFTYGTVEVRAKLAGGQGPWPAIWMLGANCQQTNIISPDNTPPCSWPQPGSDEIDITEILVSNHTAVNQQIHSSLGSPGCNAQTTDVSQNWHTYDLIWAAGSVTWQIDGQTTCTITSAVPSHPMFLLLNTALGGGGGSINASTLPQNSNFDYVRVTQPGSPTPTVTSVAPSSGPATGGRSVTITGTNLSGATAVKFGGSAATTFAVNSATQITATSPAGGSGTVDVTVTTPLGGTAITVADQFTYVLVPPVPVSVAALAGETSALVSWSEPTLPGFTPPVTGYSVSGAPGGVASVGGTSMSVVISGLTDGTAYTFTVTATNTAGTSPPSAPSNSVVPGRGAYRALTPARILDTRDGTGGVPVVPLGAGASLNVQITGQGAVPTTGVSAVVLNVTATNTTAASYLTVWPAGVSRPTASNLNWTAGETVPNLVEVALEQNGQVSAYNASGSVDVIFDVAGYVATPTATPSSAGLYSPVVPNRVLDTRNGTGGVAVAPVGAGQTISVTLAGTPTIPASGVAAVVLNVTATGPTAPSFLTVFPTGGARPTASNLNFVAGQTVPNRVIVELGTGGGVSFYNGAGSVDVLADVAGWFTDGTTVAGGSLFVGVTPARILDTRTTNSIGAGATLALLVAGAGGVPTMSASVSPKAVVLNVTVTNPSAASFMTVWPDGTPRPLASDLNYVARQTVANLVIVKLGTNGSIDIFNAVGTTDVVVDVVGWYG
jgi:beta-glucanase (GH16 family)